MAVQDASYLRLVEFEDLFPSRPQHPASKKAADVLLSRVISGFEAAVEQGVQPMDALALILNWVSSEMVRIQLEQAGGPQ
ncbi:MAG: hypothetical protein ACLPPF_08395 [Rhodomicrobium sp.]